MKILNRIATRLLGTILCCASIVPQMYAAEANPKREMRATWVSTAWRIDWPATAGTSTTTVNAQKNEIVSTLDQLKKDGFNAVFFQVRPMADRLYAKNSWTDPKTGTKYTVAEPWSAYVSGTRGTAAGSSFDPLQYWIDEAHKRGMELHAWVNPYRHPGSNSLTEDKDVNSWLVYYNSKYIFNPALPQTVARIANVCRVLAGNYDVDGIVFDDYFYPEGMCSLTGTDAPDYAQYKAYKDGGGTMTAPNWRRDCVNRMVAEVNAAIKAIKPWVRFGISPAGAAGAGRKSTDGIPPLSDYCKASDWQYASIGSDPIAWLRDGSIDYISPQLYWKTNHSTNPFGPMTEWWSVVAGKFGRHHYASLSLSFLGETDANTEANRQDVVDQIKLSRSKNHDVPSGAVLFSNKAYINNSSLKTMVAGQVYAKKAAVPAMTWYDAADPGLVSNLTLDGTTLAWDALDNVRYIVYAVPSSVAEDKTVSVDGGMLADYIVDITYTNSMTVPAGDYRYYVAPLDRYGNEWPATQYGVKPVVYEPQPDPATYADKSAEYDNTKIEWSLKSLWMRGPKLNPIEQDIELHRDMVAHSTPATGDIVYIISRDEASSKAPSRLVRYDAATGALLAPLTLTYDANFNPGYFPGNGLVVDDANQLLTHTLTLANGTLSIAKINPETGACTTVFSQKSDLRVDHLDVYGEAGGAADWFVFAPSPTGVTRWTMNGTTVKAKDFMAVANVGNAARVHALDGEKFWLNGQGMAGGLYKFGQAEPIDKFDNHVIAPASNSASAITTFVLDGEPLMFYQYNSPKDGICWALAHGANFTNTIEGAKHVWVLPEGGLGTTAMVSGDFGAPVSVLLSDPADVKTQGVVTTTSTKSARLFAYSPGNGLAAYSLEQRSTVTTIEEDPEPDPTTDKSHFAYGLYFDKAEGQNNYSIHFKSTGDAAKAVLVATNKENADDVYEQELGQVVKGDNMFEFDASVLPTDLAYNWAIRIHNYTIEQDVISTPVNVGGGRAGLATMVDPEYPDVYGYTVIGRTQNGGIDVYDPAGVKVQTAIHKNCAAIGGTAANTSSPMDACQRGNEVYLASWGDTSCGVVAFDLTTPNVAPYNVFEGTNTGNGTMLTGDGVKTGSGTPCVGLWGEGENTTIVTFDEDIFGNKLTKNVIGNGKTTGNPAELIGEGYNALLFNTNVGVKCVKDGIFASQIRANGMEAGTPGLCYISMPEGELLWKTADMVAVNAAFLPSATASVDVNRDGDLLAVSTYKGVNVYHLSWDGNKPVLESYKSIVTPYATSTRTNVRFDAGNNIHVTNQANGYYTIALAKEEPISTTPAPSVSTIQRVDDVKNINVDAVTEGEAVYYNLNGVRVSGKNLPAGVYVKVVGKTATKVIIK